MSYSPGCSFFYIFILLSIHNISIINSLVQHNVKIGRISNSFRGMNKNIDKNINLRGQTIVDSTPLDTMSYGIDNDKDVIDETEVLSTTDIINNYFNRDFKAQQTEVMLPLKSIRDEGSKMLSLLKKPYGKDEAWRHANLKVLFENIPTVKNIDQVVMPTAEELNQYIDENCKESHLVFVNGYYCPSISKTSAISSEITCNSLKANQQILKNPTFESMLLNVRDKNELPRDSFASDILTAMNMANMEDACLIHIPKGVIVTKPIQIIQYNSKDSSSFPRSLIVLEENSELQLKQTYVSPIDDASFVNGNTQILVHTGAKLQHTYIQELSVKTRHIEVLSADVQSNGTYDVAILQMGSRIGRVNAHVDLKGEGANCTMQGITMANSKQSLDLHSSLLHDTPSANSKQEQRNLIGDRGEAIFKGRIRIPKHAQLTESDQLCRSLMLGERARVIAMPTLEITADNVVCSHGASVTDLDENSMFYLSARGINRREARKLLLRGFALELLTDYVMDKAAIERVIAKINLMYSAGDKSAGSQGFFSI